MRIISSPALLLLSSSYSGQGEALFRSGNKYSGEFRRGVMDGRGCYTWISDGTVYEGDFRNNEITGTGRYSWSDGSGYEGGVALGLRDGHGVFTSADGTLVYEGSWQKSKRHGRGEQRYGVGTKDVSSYAGDWKANCRHGHGTMTYASGNVYEGEWVEDHKEGMGVMNWKERRERYTGNWKQDLQCGYGEHVWIEERPVSAVSMDTQKQMCNVYRGEWLDGMRHGQGTFMYADGSRHTGQWRKNKKHGPAVFMSDNGRTFEGLFDDDVMLGKVGQDDEHPELSAAVKLKIADILSSGTEVARAAAVRDVESDLKLLYKHYAKPEMTAPRDSTMFTMSMEQFVVFARDCRALAPCTRVTVGEVYRMFFRMRRQHTLELNQSLERAMASGPSTDRHRPSTEHIEGEGGEEKRDGDGHSSAYCSESDSDGRLPQGKKELCVARSDLETEGGIYDSRRAITFREYTEGIVRLARMVSLHAGTGDGSNNFAATAAANIAASGGGVPRNMSPSASRATTPRSSALARIGTAPIEGGGSLSLSAVGENTVSSNDVTATRDAAAAVSAAGVIDRGGASQSFTEGRAVINVNADFKRFVGSHLSELLTTLSVNAAFGGGVREGDRRGGGRGGGGGDGDGRGEGRGGTGGGKGGRGGGAAVARMGAGGTVDSKLEDKGVGPVESPCVSSLYRIYSGPLLVPMTLRGLLRMARDAGLQERVGLTSEDVKRIFKQANAFLQSRDGPATPDIAGSTPPRGAVTKVADPDKKEGNPVEALRLSSSTALGGGGVGFPLPTVDSATVCLVGAAPCTVDLDLLDQELMPDEFKVVIAGLFELARDQNSQSPCAADDEGVENQPVPPVESLYSDDPAWGGGTREGDGEQPPASYSGAQRKADSAGGGDGGATAASGVSTQGTPTPGAKTAAHPVQNGESKGEDSASLDAGEGSTNTTAAAEAVEAAPEWLADPKAFVSRVIQWAGEGSAKRSKAVRAKPPTREMPKLLASSLFLKQMQVTRGRTKTATNGGTFLDS
ncbi:unnamed protein product [Ectocarpus sp. CCAP 1310/34]|nr:unnamed protein product [Ectocarpus sp. CCAP 1310/34]